MTKWFRQTPALPVWVLLLTLLGVSVRGQDDKTGIEPAAALSIELSSPYVEVDVGSNGNFTMGTLQGDPANPNDDNANLLYGHPGIYTGAVTLRVDGVDYWNYPSNSIGTLISGPTTSGGVNTTVWEAAGIRFTQRLSLVTGTATGRVDTLCIENIATNIDSVPHDVGIREFLDTQLGSNDAAPFQVPGLGAVTAETELIGAAIPQNYQVFDDLANPQVIAAGTLSGGNATPPDRVVWALWSRLNDTPWDFTVDSSRVFGDTGVAIYWNPQTLQPGQSRSVITYYGLSSVQVSVGPLVLGLTAPAQLDVIGGTYSPNPFTVTGFIENSLAGTPTAQGVVAELILPAGLELEPGQTNPQNIGDLNFDQSAQGNWLVRATGTPTGTLTMTMRVTTTNLTPSQQDVSRDILVPPLSAGPLAITAMTDNGNGGIDLSWIYTGQGTPVLYGVALFDWETGMEHYLDLGGPGDPWLPAVQNQATIPVNAGGYYTAFVAAVVEMANGVVESAAGQPPQQEVLLSDPVQELVIFQPGTPVTDPPNPAVSTPASGEILASWGLQRALALVAVVVFDYQAGDFLRDGSWIHEVYRPVEIWPGPQPFGAHPTSVSYTGLAPGEYAVRIYHLGWDGSVADSSAAAQSAGFPDGWFHVMVH